MEPVIERRGWPAAINILNWLAVSLLCCAGCQPQTAQVPATEKRGGQSIQNVPTLSAGQIVESTRQAYATAVQYMDEATLHLSYRLNGRFMEEPHPWHVRYARPGKLKSSIYHLRLRADGERMSCFIYDFGSGNLDNQHVVHPYSNRLPVRKLFADDIARYYSTGHTELPLNPDSAMARDALFPPTIGLLTQQLDVPWFDGQLANAVADEPLDGVACYVLQFNHQGLPITTWIDKQSFLIRQINYPRELLDPGLFNTDAVQDLKLVARFHKARFEAMPGHNDFDLALPDDARVVKRFVAVPEPFPSSMVGQPIQRIGLRGIDGAVINPETWQGKVALLAWLTPSTRGKTFARQLGQLRSKLPQQEYHIGLVENFQHHRPGDPQVKTQLIQLAESFGVDVYADFAFDGGRALGLVDFPALVVLDRQGRLQFVTLPETDSYSIDEVATVLYRVRSGDDVAAEMQFDYEQFLDNYHRELEELSIQNRWEFTSHSKMVDAGLPQSFRVEKIWENTDLKQPGNVLTLPNSSQVLVVDGWRTVARVSDDGRLLQQTTLEFDPQQSIARLRTDLSGKQSVLYSVMGRSAVVVDENLNRLFEFQSNAVNNSHRISDTLLADLDTDRTDELLVLTPGDQSALAVSFSGAPKTSALPKSQSWRSAAIIPQGDFWQLVVIDENGRALIFDPRERTTTSLESPLNTVTGVFSARASHLQPFCLIGTDIQGRWAVATFTNRLQQQSMTPIGNQGFDAQVQSVAYADRPADRYGLWMIGASDGSICLVAVDGTLIDQWNYGRPIHGIALLPQLDHFLAVISTENQLEGWKVTTERSTATSAARPATDAK